MTLVQLDQCSQCPIFLRAKWVKLDGEEGPCGDHSEHISDKHHTS